jgi:hypothetical protein
MEGRIMMILTDQHIARGFETHFEGNDTIESVIGTECVEKNHVCLVRVCPAFYPLKPQVLFLRYYIKKHPLVPLYRLLMCCTTLKRTHIVIIISTKVQYSIVSVLV